MGFASGWNGQLMARGDLRPYFSHRFRWLAALLHVVFVIALQTPSNKQGSEWCWRERRCRPRYETLLRKRPPTGYSECRPTKKSEAFLRNRKNRISCGRFCKPPYTLTALTAGDGSCKRRTMRICSWIRAKFSGWISCFY